jgi:riboflavin synthase alpha subunit
MNIKLKYKEVVKRDHYINNHQNTYHHFEVRRGQITCASFSLSVKLISAQKKNLCIIAHAQAELISKTFQHLTIDIFIPRKNLVFVV